MLEQLAQPLPALAVSFEFVWRAEKVWVPLGESKLHALEERIRARLHVALLQFWLPVEHVQPRWRAGHVQVDHALCFRGDLADLGREWIRHRRGTRCPPGRLAEQGTQCHAAEPGITVS